MIIDDEELRSVFKAASEEHLQNLDTGLLHLEKHPGDQATLESLLREAHSLKGDANMLGVKHVGTLAHQIEYILTQLKQQQIVFSQELGDCLAEGVSAIHKLVHEAVTGEPAEIDPFHALATLMGGRKEEPQDEEIAEPEEYLAVDQEINCEIAQNIECETNGATPSCQANDLAVQSEILSTDVFSNVTIASPATLSAPTLSPTATPVTTPTPTSNTYRIETIRVPTRSLDNLMTQAGELTVTKIRIAHRLTEIEAISTLWDEWSRDLLNHRSHKNHLNGSNAKQSTGEFSSLASWHRSPENRFQQIEALISKLRDALYEDTKRLELISDELAEGICTLRLLPLSTIFNLFPRMVRDLARQENKQVELLIEGSETRADKRILEEMKDPLMHLLRNAVDHGIESPTERERLGKPATATIQLRSYQTPTHVVIEIEDDGCGLDLKQIKQTALKRGLYREEDFATMTDSQIQSLIFTPGFSTAPLVTEVSGRGVGLDVVQTNVEKLKGTLHVASTSGQGCLFRIQLSITLATAHVLIVIVNDIPYAIPVEFVRTACLINTEEIFTLESRETMIRDGKPISVARLADLLELPVASNRSSSQKQHQIACLILQAGQEQLGILVDAVIDEQDVVIKPQNRLLKRVRNVSGATILGTGEVCIVLNPQDLIKSVQRQTPIAPSTTVSAAIEKQTILLVEDSIATRTQEKRMLESAGYEVVTAVDGHDGFNKLSSRAFDAIISDVQMPNLDGLQLTAKIRQQREYNELPIILVTSLASDEDKRRGAEAGANAYITKSSLNQSILIETLRRLI